MSVLAYEQNGESWRTLLKTLYVPASERDANFVCWGRRDGTRCVVAFITLSDVTHPVLLSRIDRGDYGGELS